MKKQPVLFRVQGMRNLGQIKWRYDKSSGHYEKEYYGPEYVSITLRSLDDASENVRLVVTDILARQFHLNDTVELWPAPGPKALLAAAEVAELKKLFSKGKSI